MYAGHSYLVYEEPSCEEESDPQQDKSEVGENCRVDGGDIAG